MACRPAGATPGREDADTSQRRTGTAAPGAALGPDRQGLPLRDRRGERLTGRPLPRALTAAHLSLHVRAGLHRGLSRLLGDRRRLQRLRDSPGQPRRDALGGVTRPAGEAAGLQAADGLELPLGLLV